MRRGDHNDTHVQLEDDVFVVVAEAGARAIFGYPVRELARAERTVLAMRTDA